MDVDISTCKGSEFGDALAKIKEIPGRKFDGERKIWSVPAEPAVAERVLHSLQPNADQELMDWIKQARTQSAQELTTPLPEDAKLHIPWATERAHWQPEHIFIAGEKDEFLGLMKHQRPVVDIAAAQRKLLICDDMGLGKTGSAISAIEEARIRHQLIDGTKPDGPKLIICPNSVKGSWERELNLWLESPAYQVIDASSPAARRKQLEEAIADNAWVIVNWEQLRVKKETLKLKNGGKKKITVMKEPLFEETAWFAVVGDEIHRAKNRKSQQTQGFWRCRADDGIMLGLSGTPMMNSPDELWAILKWLWPKEYTSYWRFYTQYVDYYEGYFGKVITGVRNPDALRFELKDRLVRRTKEQAGIGTKGKRRIPVPVKLNPKQRKLYDDAVNDLWLKVEQDVKDGDENAKRFAEALARGDSVQTLYRMPNGASRFVRLRQIVETPATLGAEDDSAVLDACVDKVMDSRPEQWVIFCQFKPTVACLIERLEKLGVTAKPYTGDQDADTERKDLERDFQAGNVDVLVGTIDAMKEGITLTAGHNQFWVSRSVVPDVNEQGEDRQDRIGQSKKVLVWIAQAQDTVATEKVEPINRLKERIVRAVLPKDSIEGGP